MAKKWKKWPKNAQKMAKKRPKNGQKMAQIFLPTMKYVCEL